jgi:hypothetical protein
MIILTCRGMSQPQDGANQSINHKITNEILRQGDNQHKMRITQAMSNPLEYLLALRRGKVKNPSQSPRSEPETSTFLRSTILATPSYLGGDNHQE